MQHRSSVSVPRALAGVAAVTALILLVPLAAMQFTDAVDWTPLDFAVAAVLIFGAGLAFVLVTRRARSLSCRLAFGLAVAALFVLVWANLAVGLVGHPGNPANVLFFGVPLVGMAGAIVAGLKPAGMVRTMLAMAVAQLLVGVIALAAGWVPAGGGFAQLLAVSAAFIALYLAAAALFRRAHRRDPGMGRQ